MEARRCDDGLRRFGKLISLSWGLAAMGGLADSDGEADVATGWPLRVSISTYLLEISRVVTTPPSERCAVCLRARERVCVCVGVRLCLCLCLCLCVLPFRLQPRPRRVVSSYMPLGLLSHSHALRVRLAQRTHACPCLPACPRATAARAARSTSSTTSATARRT
jgi:hypothetical protein